MHTTQGTAPFSGLNVGNGRSLPDVMLMDTRIPLLNDIDATAEAMHSFSSVKTLLMKTCDHDDYALGALDAGPSSYFLQDTQSEQLLRVICYVSRGESVLTPRITAKLMS